MGHEKLREYIPQLVNDKGESLFPIVQGLKMGYLGSFIKTYYQNRYLTRKIAPLIELSNKGLD